MRTFTTLLVFLCMGFSVFAQTIVSTQPENKKAVLEEFTGIGCPNCPGGHTQAATLLASNPNLLFVLAYHPSNSSYTSGDPMVSTYPSAFYSNPFISPTNRYMPSAMVSRRVWGGVERIQGVSSWAADVATILGEASPLNVGVGSTYDETQKMLTVNAEVYFTSDVTDNLTIYCMLTEDGVEATQAGSTASPYIHNHVFRQALVAQWGDPVAAPTTLGTTKTFSFTFDNSVKNYDMAECEVLVYVRNANTEEIISGNGAPVGETSTIGVGDIAEATAEVMLSPNPADNGSNVHIDLPAASSVLVKVTNLAGQLVFSQDYGMQQAGSHTFALDATFLNQAGLYLVSVNTGSKSVVRKLVVR